MPPQHRHHESENPELVFNEFLVALVVVSAMAIFFLLMQIMASMLVHLWEFRQGQHEPRPVASSRSSLSSLSSLSSIEPLPAYSLMDPEAAPLLGNTSGSPPPEYQTFLREDNIHLQIEGRDDSWYTMETSSQ
ncbi:hypothetical protein CKAH01_14013 [Colletotrichum kahawae]|uniref:Uncharacterized protein n=1 Tax=Colletotrichum kahawae TaxID=34407 RepID=A0AAE0DA91_COLKA|nr:hypothetical protein CKAH01_14013 [Colletotrichum kahawae]